jgi:hypothetical protein
MGRTVDALVVEGPESRDPEALEHAAIASVALLHLADRLDELDPAADDDLEAVVV